jgi:uncharacterized membrane protein
MYSKAKLFGHPIHPMLVAFPVAFYTGTFVAFINYATSHDPFWFRLATVANWAGVVTAVMAAVPGLIDWSAGIPRRSPAKAVGLVHMSLNVISLLIFLVNAVIYSNRWSDPLPAAGTGIVFSAIGVLMTVSAGFLGWSLVQDHHVGVHLSAEQERLEPTLPGASDDRHHPSYAGR